MFSPSVTAALQPSPARKKLSLSDYTRRTKAKDVRDPNDPKLPYDRDSSPASVASGPIAPPLQASASFLEAKASGEGEGSAVMDDAADARMEDADVADGGGGDGGEEALPIDASMSKAA